MPAIVRTAGVESNAETFKVFSNPKRKRQARLIEGQNKANSHVEYRGVETQEQRYCLVVKDKETNKIELVEVPVFDIDAVVANERTKHLEQSIDQNGVENWQQRTKLGEAFGTKRAKTAITDVTRNRIDAEMLEGMEDAIVNNVKTRTVNMQSNFDAANEASNSDVNEHRPIPRFDAEATDVRNVYPITNIISQQDLDALLGLVEEMQSIGHIGAIDKLPYKDSEFIKAQVEHVMSEDTNVGPRLQLLFYASFLIAVYKNRRVNSKQQLIEKIPNAPRPLFDNVLNEFTTSKPGKFGTSKERSFVFDPFHTDKLLCYLFALMLHINSFELDVTPIAHELSSPVTKIESLFRNLGCVVRRATKEDLKQRELSNANGYKIATLSAPLKLPNLTKRRRN